MRSLAALEAAAARASTGSIVDLTARAYDGDRGDRRRRDAAGAPVLAVGQHDDVELRRRALAAGADRVLRIGACSRTARAMIAAWLAQRDAVEPPA